MQTTRDEPIMRALRNQMEGAGITIEFTKGEWGRGQHEVNFQYSRPIEMADGRMVFKQGAKEIADTSGKCITFVSKFVMT